MEKVAQSGSVTRRFALGGQCEASGLGLADRRGARISIY